MAYEMKRELPELHTPRRARSQMLLTLRPNFMLVVAMNPHPCIYQLLLEHELRMARCEERSLVLSPLATRMSG